MIEGILYTFRAHSFEITSIILFGIGFLGMFFHKNLIKKIVGFDIMDAAIYLFMASRGYIFQRSAPIIQDGKMEAMYYINPIPTGLVLTGIVVSVSFTAFFLSLTQKLYEKYHTLDLDEISRRAHRDRIIRQYESDNEEYTDEVEILGEEEEY